MSSKTIVIFDGECSFCRSCILWLSRRCQIEALANQSIDPTSFGVTREECEASVVAIENEINFGANAISFLLDKSGWKLAARLLKLSGAIGEYGYRYIATHRNGRLVAFLHWVIRKSI